MVKYSYKLESGIVNNRLIRSQSKLNIGLWIILCLLMTLTFTGCKGNAFGEIDDYQELVIGRKNDSISLDPATATDIETFQVTANIYETLVNTAPNGIDIQAGLAKSWEVSEDGLTFVFKLNDDVKFHDNTDFNAEAVVFNFERWMNGDSPYHVGQFTYWNQSFGGDPGMIRSISALSNDTVEIVLNEPYTPFLSVISLPAFAIASPSAITKYNENLKSHPVGTGPYMLESWTDSGEIVLVQNKNYSQEKGTIDKAIFKTLSESDDYMAMIKNNEVHIVSQISEVDIEVVNEDEAIDVIYMPFLNISYLALNHLNEPFDQLKVRQAISKVIDEENLVEEAYDVFSRPAYSFIPPTLYGYDESFKNINYDIEEAKQLLSEAGYPNGFDTTIWVMDQSRNYYPNPVDVAHYISDQLKLIGINAGVVPIEWSKYTDIVGLGDHDMALVGWQGDFADPENFLYTMFYSANTEEGTVLNYSFYSNDKVDSLLRKGRRVADKEFRASIYREVQEKLYQDVASIPLAHTMTAMGISTQVNGFEPNISGNIIINNMEVMTQTDEE